MLAAPRSGPFQASFQRRCFRQSAGRYEIESHRLVAGRFALDGIKSVAEATISEPTFIASFVSQRNHRIDAGSAAGWNETGDQCDRN